MSGEGPKPLDLLASLRLEDGRPWGEAATRVQFEDARAVLEGQPPYNYITRARGYAKTADLAGVALSLLITLPAHSRCYWLAADESQGRLALDSITGYVARIPLLGDWITVRSSRVEAARTGSALEVLAADAPSAWGLRPAAVFVDEFAMWPQTTNAQRLWEAVSSAVLKVEGARLVIITTAGSPTCLAAKVLDHARSSSLWRVSETPGPPPWTSAERLAEQRARLPAGVYEQLFENRWTHAEGAFLDPDALADCTSLDGPARHPERHRYLAGLDLGHTNDRTALAIGHREDDAVHLDRLTVWDPPVSFEDVERTIYEAWQRFRFALHADPWQALHVLERLRSRGLHARERTFSPSFKQRLASTLLQAVNDRALRLYPDEELRDELLALEVRQTATGWSFDHASGGHDDRATALSLMLVAALETAPAAKHRRKPRTGGYRRTRTGDLVLPDLTAGYRPDQFSDR